MRGNLAPFGAIAVSFAMLAGWSWRKWPDLLVDFGQQLYVPWQLASGKHLYSDIHYLHGPLSQHYHALLFALFGSSLSVLIWSNLAILAVLTWIAYTSTRAFSDRWTAVGVCLVLLGLFGFSQYVGTGNYNFITPYTHETTHGIILAQGLVLVLCSGILRGGRRAWAVAGLCLGLSLLTKVEIGLAALVTAAAGVVLAALRHRIRRAELAFFLTGALLPPAGFLAYFMTHFAPDRAIRAVAGGFVPLSLEVARNPFYLGVTGMDDPGGNVIRMLVAFGWVAAFVLAGIAIDYAVRRLGAKTTIVAPVMAAGLFLLLAARGESIGWHEIPRALPAIALTMIIVFSVLMHRRWRRGNEFSQLLPMLLGSILALSVTAKTALNMHFYHYGFYLAVPATMLLVAVLIWWIPRALHHRYGGGTIFRIWAFTFIAACVGYHLHRSNEFYRVKTLSVGSGGDRIQTYSATASDQGPVVADALAWLSEHTGEHDTMTAFPDGIMLNYLSRRASPIPVMNYFIPAMYREAAIVDALKSEPPGYILLVHHDTREFGFGYFGTEPGYGFEIMSWVQDHYTPVTCLGAVPFTSERFGILIAKRNDERSAGPGQ